MQRFFAVLLLSLSVDAFAAAATLCRPNETHHFDCTMGVAHKIASLCGRDDAGVRYLQYRFGRAGQPPELVVPPTLDDPAMGSTFFFDAGIRADGRRRDWGVWFRRLGATYELEYSIDNDVAPHGEATIALWPGRLSQTGMNTSRVAGCANAEGARRIESARDAIEALAPPARDWQMSPFDWEVAADHAALVAASVGASVAASASAASAPQR